MNGSQHGKLNQSNFQFPLLYALPKIHMPGELKMRPISSDIQSPNYKIAHLTRVHCMLRSMHRKNIA